MQSTFDESNLVAVAVQGILRRLASAASGGAFKPLAVQMLVHNRAQWTLLRSSAPGQGYGNRVTVAKPSKHYPRHKLGLDDEDPTPQYMEPCTSPYNFLDFWRWGCCNDSERDAADQQGAVQHIQALSGSNSRTKSSKQKLDHRFL